MWTLTFFWSGLIHLFFPRNSQTYARHLWQCAIRSRRITNWSMDKRKKIDWQFFSIISVFVVIHSQCVQSLNFMYKKPPPRQNTHSWKCWKGFVHIYFIPIFSRAVQLCQFKTGKTEKNHTYQYTRIHTRSLFILKSDKNAKCPSNLMRIKILFMVNIVWIIVSNGQYALCSFFSPLSLNEIYQF